MLFPWAKILPSLNFHLHHISVCASSRLTTYSCVSSRLTDTVCVSSRLTTYSCASSRLTDSVCASSRLTTYSCVSSRLTDTVCVSSRLITWLRIFASYLNPLLGLLYTITDWFSKSCASITSCNTLQCVTIAHNLMQSKSSNATQPGFTLRFYNDPWSLFSRDILSASEIHKRTRTKLERPHSLLQLSDSAASDSSTLCILVYFTSLRACLRISPLNSHCAPYVPAAPLIPHARVVSQPLSY